MNTPLMPKATAVWLVDNTSLTFDQIADFCKLHPLEVAAIADGDSATTIKGLDPIQTGQLSRDDLEKGQADPAHRLTMLDNKVRVPVTKRKGPRYTPVSRRQDRPNAILWLLRSHPEMKDAQIMRLVGTTKPTIESIRNRTHWNSNNLSPMDPVTLGLCSQLDLDMEVEKAAKLAPAQPAEAEGAVLLPADETAAPQPDVFGLGDQPAVPAAPTAEEEAEAEADAVFAKLKSMKGPEDQPEQE